MSKMENLIAKMTEYLHMDTEIEFVEFTDYYRQVTDYLNLNYDSMSKDELLKAKFILTIVTANSGSRAQRKGTNAKKYKKMQEKTSFWGNAINFRLLKEGMTQKEIDEQVEKISQACEGEEKPEEKPQE